MRYLLPQTISLGLSSICAIRARRMRVNETLFPKQVSLRFANTLVIVVLLLRPSDVDQLTTDAEGALCVRQI